MTIGPTPAPFASSLPVTLGGTSGQDPYQSQQTTNAIDDLFG